MNLFSYLDNKVNTCAYLDDKMVNWVEKAPSTFGKIYHRLWNKRDIKLETKIVVYNVALLAILLYGSHPWLPIDNN